MVTEVYEAFIAAGTPKDKARKAAEALANYDGRFFKIETDILILKWMTSTIIAGVFTLILKAFF